MILTELTYALNGGKPLAIEIRRARAWLENANKILSNPDLAHYLSAWSDKYEPKKKGSKRERQKMAIWDDEDSTDMQACTDLLSPPTNAYVDDGMGIIPVVGVIGKNLSRMEKMMGCCDIADISDTLDAWEERTDITEIVFDFDSGGGSTSGLEELAKKIRTYKKPTIAYVEGDCGSAAYWLGSQCNRFVVTPSASIGSCGIYLTMTDETVKHEKEGKKVVIIKSGEYKAAGVENTALTELQKQRLQDEVDELHRRFIRDVKSVRIFASELDMQGQSFYGDESVSKGLATAVVDGWKDFTKQVKDMRKVLTSDLMSKLYSTNYPEIRTAGYLGSAPAPISQPINISLVNSTETPKDTTEIVITPTQTGGDENIVG